MMEKNKILTIAIIVAIVLVVGYLMLGSQAQVSAQGVSTLKGTPDQVLVYFVIETHNVSQQESQLQNTRISDQLSAQLEASGISEDHVKFSGFSSYPEYDWRTGSQKLLGYVTRQDVVVELGEFSEAADVVRAGIEGGAYVSTISLELSQEAQNSYKVQALEEASKDARSKAEAQARGLGKRLGRLVSVSSQDFSYYPVPYYTKVSEGYSASDAGAAQDAARSIAPQDVDVSATVGVTYKLSRF